MPAEAVSAASWLPGMGRVLGRARETKDTVTLVVEPPAGMARPAPGQFNMVTVPGFGEIAISISGDGHGTGRLEHTVRAVGAASRRIAELRAGEALGLRGPFGHGWPIDDARGRDVVVVAGGVGLAPLRPAIRYLVEHRDQFGRVAVLYGARTPADILYWRELERWRGRFDIQVLVTVDRGDAAWRGPVGVVTTLLDSVHAEPEDMMALVCGPEVMMRAVANRLLHRRCSAEQIYVSLERNMQCGVGLCGHCQLGPFFVCRDGPVFRYDRVARLLTVKEL